MISQAQRMQPLQPAKNGSILEKHVQQKIIDFVVLVQNVSLHQLLPPKELVKLIIQYLEDKLFTLWFLMAVIR